MNDQAFFFRGTALLAPDSAAVTAKDLQLPAILAETMPVTDIFTIPALNGADSITGVTVPSETALPPHTQEIPVRQIFAMFPDNQDASGAAAKIIRAFHIAQWRKESRFCGSCGSKNTETEAELARFCPCCGRIEYPRITPAVIVLIVNSEGKALLAHNKKFVPDIYSLIAGFTEAGENLETTVVREIREEVGIEVEDVRYVVSQPWPFPFSLMVGFTARYKSGDVKPDGTEIEDARWFSSDNLPKLPGPGSVSRDLIERWLKGAI